MEGCNAHVAHFHEGDRGVERGVITYYAARTLPYAHTVGEWLKAIETESDREAGERGALFQLKLQITGDPALPLPGKPRGGRTEDRE